ncbi:uncharacterized protein LOC131031427 isoform X2 [Cryptomeria japonica]|uniref:uncharacterized protein LOC131031427 isoform X2 n=1 Tax=Cryptomeria japonica TaxID=3369 RepID=UPI0025ABB683|nr:uncharacterized protein LOC131031427 isoform X2 [Cryptomeria japonica]XP_057818528.1 uncharacterized protein LOC131031427 isoform X2 [Cryptomeria japonica]
MLSCRASSSWALCLLRPVTRFLFNSVHVGHGKAARRSSLRVDARKLLAKNQSRTPFKNKDNQEITRAKKILGVAHIGPNADEGNDVEQESKNKNPFEVWLDNRAEDGGSAENWVQRDRAQRKFYEKRRRRMYGTDSDQDEKIPEEDKYIELKPEIVEFKSLYEKQEELYFYDAFCFPWEKDKHYQMIRKLEQKYFPDQGLEKAFLDPDDELLKPKEDIKDKPKHLGKTALVAQAEEKNAERSKIQMSSSSEWNGAKGLAQDKAQKFVKSLKNIPNFDEVSDAPYIVTRKSELPARWNGPKGTVLLIDKPKGWTSFTVCGKLRRLVKVEKVGHAGTLDPMATGLLIVCVGKATKQVQSFQDMTKVYSGIFRLGEATSTWDADSAVTERESWEHIKDEDIQKVARSFFGEIWQVPPMFSAIKIGGQKMYDKARRGETIDLPPRKVSIYKFDVQRSLDDRQNLIFKATCSKGTYVRSLCSDFGKALGSCAHLVSLRRDQIGDYSLVDAWKFSELEDQIVKLYI